MPTLAYYVSGHGFGHARRTAEVLRALASVRPDVAVSVRTAAPASIFAGIDTVRVSAPVTGFDPAAVERDALSVDGPASLRRLGDTLARRDELVGAEAAWLRQVRAEFVAFDIPFLAADAAWAAGVSGVAVGNFTWDWIFEPYATTAAERQLIEQLRASHALADGLLQMPLGHDVIGFREVTPVPLVAGRARRESRETLAAAGLDDADPRPRILIAMRGGVSPGVLRNVAADTQDYLFIAMQPVDDSPPNLRAVDASRVDFTDLLATCAAAVSKVGYGILSDCIANGVALLYPPRAGFREDDVTTAEAPRYMRMRELPADAFAAGTWAPHLTALLAQPAPPAAIAMDGAAVVARALSERLGRTTSARSRG